MFRRVMLLVLSMSTAGLGGCSKPDHAATVRAKFQQLTTYVCQDDMESCLPLADPLYVRAQGADKVKFQLKILTGLFKLGKVTAADVRIDEIIVAPDAKSAEVRFSLQIKGVWKSQNPSRWVFSEGQWYLAF